VPLWDASSLADAELGVLDYKAVMETEEGKLIVVSYHHHVSEFLDTLGESL